MSAPPRVDAPVVDLLGRPLRDLRISVTDRCNFRCAYCMPRSIYGPEHLFLARAELLTFEEIERLARIFVELGVRKLRLTGGEPLLRRDLPELIRRLVPLGVPIALTTNGSLLRVQAAALREAGLTRLTVSLDTLDPAVFRRMNDADFDPEDVLDGIAAAEAAGFGSIKINAVVRRGVNEDGLLDLVRKFRGSPHVLRFVEYMDVGASNGWQLQDVVSAAEILQRITAESSANALDAIAPQAHGEVAKRYRYRDGSGEIGIISSVSQPFCGDCVRARLSADGRIFTCLFATLGSDIKTHLRAGATDEELAAEIGALWRRRDDRYSELRSQATSSPAPPGRDVVHRRLSAPVPVVLVLLEEGVEGGSGVLRHRRGLLRGELLAFPGLEELDSCSPSISSPRASPGVAGTAPARRDRSARNGCRCADRIRKRCSAPQARRRRRDSGSRRNSRNEMCSQSARRGRVRAERHAHRAAGVGRRKAGRPAGARRNPAAMNRSPDSRSACTCGRS